MSVSSIRPSEYGPTPCDTPRLSAAAYWMRTGTPNLLSPTASGSNLDPTLDDATRIVPHEIVPRAALNGATITCV